MLGEEVAVALVLSGNKTYGGASGTANSWLVQSGTLSGVGSSGSDGQISPLDFYIKGDTVDTTTSGPGYLTALSVRDDVQANHSGGRTAISRLLSANSQTKKRRLSTLPRVRRVARDRVKRIGAPRNAALFCFGKSSARFF